MTAIAHFDNRANLSSSKGVYLCTSKHYSKEHFVHLQQFHKAHGEVTIQQHSSTAFHKVLFFFVEKTKRKKERKNNTAQDVKTSMLNICKQWSLSLLLSSPRRKQEEKAPNDFFFFFCNFSFKFSFLFFSHHIVLASMKQRTLTCCP